MNDLKNFFLAYFSAFSSVFAAFETRTVITIISAIVLPIIFFTIGKTVDVLLQIYLNRQREGRGIRKEKCISCEGYDRIN